MLMYSYYFRDWLIQSSQSAIKLEMRDRTLIAKHILGKGTQPRQRLEFPQITQQRKHFQSKHEDQIRFGTQQHENVRYVKHNKLDISDIEGAKPKLKNEANLQKRRLYTLEAQPHQLEQKDQLDKIARKSLTKRNYSLKQLSSSKARYQAFTQQQNHNNIFSIGNNPREVNKDKVHYQHLRTQSVTKDHSHPHDKYKIVDPSLQNRATYKKSILQNPTYISSLFL